MKDSDCIQFLQWALPQLGLRWRGFRRVRGQVCKRLHKRIAALKLIDLADYRAMLGRKQEEWQQLDAMCRISISRFYRDYEVFRQLEREWLPGLLDDVRIRGEKLLRIWSLGCASGEEPYTLALMWAFNVTLSEIPVEIIATDADARLLARARRACYPPSSLRELPARWRAAFVAQGEAWCLQSRYRAPVRFREHDIRKRSAIGPFDLIICRNLVFTYFSRPLQIELARRLAQALVPGGLLVLGTHEALPGEVSEFETERSWLYRRRPA